jgi:hypothetical protein
MLINRKKTIKLNFNLTRGITKKIKKNPRGRNDLSKPECVCRHTNHAWGHNNFKKKNLKKG